METLEPILMAILSLTAALSWPVAYYIWERKGKGTERNRAIVKAIFVGIFFLLMWVNICTALAVTWRDKPWLGFIVAPLWIIVPFVYVKIHLWFRERRNA